VNVFACIDALVAIKKILTHLKEKAASQEPIQLPKSRASPQVSLFAWGAGNRVRHFKVAAPWRSRQGVSVDLAVRRNWVMERVDFHQWRRTSA